MPEDEHGYLVVSHEVATGTDCDGCLMVVERDDAADLKCNFGAVLDLVPLERRPPEVDGIHFSGGSSFSVRWGNQVMAYRSDPADFDRRLTREDLERRRRNLVMLSVHSVRDAHREAYERCKMNGDSLPRASAIQELVTMWKQLWEWRRR